MPTPKQETIEPYTHSKKTIGHAPILRSKWAANAARRGKEENPALIQGSMESNQSK